MDNYDILDLNLAEGGRRRMDWAAREMPVLQSIEERFRKERPFEGIRMSACLHVTTETANLMRTLQAGGADIVLTASNPLSTQDDVAAALISQYEIPVFAIKGENNVTYYKHLRAALDHKPNITMDDGADLVSELHKNRTELLEDVIGGTEETTTGVVRLRAMAKDGALRFPVIAVNDSMTKHLFDNRYGTGQSTLDGIMRATNVLFAGRRVVVYGYGMCGRGVASRARGLGAHVIVVEVDPLRALEAVMEGFEVSGCVSAAEKGDLFITVTGDVHVLRAEHFKKMKDGAILANSGHFNVELDLEGLATVTTSRREARPMVEEYTLKNGKKICVLAEGRLVNLGCATGHPSFVMSNSFTNQTLAQLELWNNSGNYENKVYVLPKHLDEKVARLHLEKIGVELEELNDVQAKYINVPKEGPYKSDAYRY